MRRWEHMREEYEQLILFPVFKKAKARNIEEKFPCDACQKCEGYNTRCKDYLSYKRNEGIKT